MIDKTLHLEFINEMSKEFRKAEHFNEFLANLKHDMQVHYTTYKNNKDALETMRKALIEFFSHRGIKAIVVFGAQEINIKMSIANREQNIYVDFLARYLEKKSFRNFTQEADTQGKKQYFAELFLYLQDHTDIQDEFLLKDIVRNALKRSLRLNKRDGLFFNDFDPYIKNFDFDLVKNNAEIREFKKSVYVDTLLDTQTKDHIQKSLKGTDIDILILQSLQNVLADKLDSQKLAPVDFFSGFSFFYIRELSAILSKIIDFQFAENLVNRHCIEIYRFHKTAIYQKLAFEIFKRMEQNHQGARRIVMFFDGSEKRVNGMLFYIPNISDSNSRSWNPTQINRILKSESGINFNLQQLQQLISKDKQDIKNLEEKIRTSKTLITQKESEIRFLSEEYESKKAQSDKMTNKDVETRNAMTKVINSILQKKIRLLDEITELNTAISTAQEQKRDKIQESQDATHQIDKINKENKVSIQEFQKLVNAFGFCIETIVTALDDNV